MNRFIHPIIPALHIHRILCD